MVIKQIHSHIKKRQISIKHKVSTPLSMKIITQKCPIRARRRRRVMTKMISVPSSKLLLKRLSQLVSKFLRRTAALSKSEMDKSMRSSKRSNLT